MSTVTKFTFDLDFDAPEEPVAAEVEEEEAEPEEVIPTFSEEELEQARAEGFEAGKEEGRREAADATEQRLLETVEAACAQLADVYNTQTEANRDIAREMISISTVIAKKMFPDLNARNALGEVERVVQETLKAVTEEPRIQIMVNPELREPLTERLGTMTHRAGFEGKVFVNPDPAMALGDCRIEWSNGAAVRDGEELWEMIEEIIESNLHGAPEIDMDNETPEREAQNQPEPEPAQDAAAQSPEHAPEAEAHSEAESAPAEPEAAPHDSPGTDTEVEAVNTPEENTEADPAMDADIDPQPVQAEPDHETETAQAPENAADIDEVTASETPSWEAAVGESDDTDATAVPEAAPDIHDAPAEGDDTQIFDPAREEAEVPSFAPSVGDPPPPGGTENTPSDQELNDDERSAPVPHIDDLSPTEDTAGSDTTAHGDTPAQFTDPDPVSPATQAAILDAQSAMDDDDDQNPSGG